MARNLFVLALVSVVTCRGGSTADEWLLQSKDQIMRKFLVATCVAVGLLLSGSTIQTARADHGHRGQSGHHQHHSYYGAPICNNGYGGGHGGSYRAGYPGLSGYGHNLHYGMPIPAFPSYSAGYGAYYGANPYGNFGYGGASSYYGGLPLGGYGYSNNVPRVQLRIGF